MAVPRRAGITRDAYVYVLVRGGGCPLHVTCMWATHMPHVLQLLGDVATPMQGRHRQSRAHIFTTSQRHVA